MSLSRNIQKLIVKNYVGDKFSMVQIAEKFSVSPSTIRYYLDKSGIERRSISDAITSVYITRFNKKPVQLKKHLTRDDEKLKIAGVMLYWGEGNKKGNVVSFVNSDPAMIQTFLKFLRVICGVSEERLRALLHIYTDQDKLALEKFWSRETGIPRKNFNKTYIHRGKPGNYKKKSRYGTLAVTYSDKKLLKQILVWIGEYKEKLVTPP